jgi:hypothetical protein
LGSYIAYLKLHTLVIIFSSIKAQEQTNPWLNILATFYSLVLGSYIAYLKLHTLVIVFSFAKVQELTNLYHAIL